MSAQSVDERVRCAMSEWRQGDVTLGPIDFVHLADPRGPMTQGLFLDPGDGPGHIVQSSCGAVVLTQTCDIVRPCGERPFIEVAPLVPAIEQERDVLKEVWRMSRPRYAYIPGVADRRLIADLDRVMTVEKVVAAEWKRVPGWENAEDGRRFTASVTRKRGRFAFPDEFNFWVTALTKKLRLDHDKRSAGGQALQKLREIRVLAVPSWEVACATVDFFFIRQGPATLEWDSLRTAWKELLKPNVRYILGRIRVVGLEELTAQDYVASDALDLDHLSQRPGK